MTRICVFGAGAIGGLIGAKLAKAGVTDVSLVARGAHLEAMRAKGLSVTQAGETYAVRPKVTDDPRELGRQDFVILTLKSHALPGIADTLAPLIGPDTVLLFGQNGLPWWYFYRHGGRLDGHVLESVDPGGQLWKKLGPERALGAVIWQAAGLGAPRSRYPWFRRPYDRWRAVRRDQPPGPEIEHAAGAGGCQEVRFGPICATRSGSNYGAI